MNSKNTNKYDVAVIGAGAMGSAAAYHLAKAGAKVIAFDQHPVPHSFGSSHGETRLIRQAYFENPNYVPLLRRAYQLWAELEDVPGQLFIKNGLFVAGHPDRKIMRGILASSEEHGIPIEKLNAVEAAGRFAGFNFEEDDLCIFEPNAGYLLVDESIRTTLKKARAFGAKIIERCPIMALSKNSAGFRLETSAESYQAKKVVLAAGAWSNTFLPAGFREKFVPHRVPLFWFKSRTIGGTPDVCFAFDTKSGFFYGFPQFGGATKMGLHKVGPKIDDPSDFSRDIGDDERTPVLEFMQQRTNFLNSAISQEATCIYTMTPDEDFVVDEIDGMIVLAGFSGHGFKFAPVIGEVAKDLALDGKTAHPTKFLRWRFTS